MRLTRHRALPHSHQLPSLGCSLINGLATSYEDTYSRPSVFCSRIAAGFYPRQEKSRGRLPICCAGNGRAVRGCVRESGMTKSSDNRVMIALIRGVFLDW
jgi:hypothetical protein